MADRCPNCDKPILATDVTCWHCGYQLPRRPKQPPAFKGKKTPPGFTLRRRSVAGDAPVEYDFRALAVYGLLTLAIIIALWLVMNSLSRRPILVRSADIDLGGDHVLVTDNDLRYTLAFPADWQWIDVAFREQDEPLDRMMANQPYVARALNPLGGTAGDVEILGLAIDSFLPEDTAPQPFVVIGQSERMRDIDPQTALDLLDAQPLPATDTSIDRRLAGQPQARFNIFDVDAAYQCRHLFVTGAGKPGYLVAACAPQDRFGSMQRQLDDILDSFQLLEH